MNLTFTRSRILPFALLLCGCASMSIPKDEMVFGNLTETPRGMQFVPCTAPTEYWWAYFNSTAGEDIDGLSKTGVTRMPGGVFVKMYGTLTYPENTASAAGATRIIHVDKVLRQSGSCDDTK